MAIGPQAGWELTPRELEVLNAVADGLTNPEIATLLFIAPETVKHYVKNILCKFSAKNRAHAVRIAMREGIIT